MPTATMRTNNAAIPANVAAYDDAAILDSSELRG
jgi:hypothetical protein